MLSSIREKKTWQAQPVPLRPTTPHKKQKIAQFILSDIRARAFVIMAYTVQVQITNPKPHLGTQQLAAKKQRRLRIAEPQGCSVSCPRSGGAVAGFIPVSVPRAGAAELGIEAAADKCWPDGQSTPLTLQTALSKI